MSEYIKSPLNYTGGKYKILKHLIPNFPTDINRFVDLFAGGLNVGINIDADRIYANDQIGYLIDIYGYFLETPVERIITDIKERIEQYGLSLTNGEGYNNLRAEYNQTKNVIDLFVLTCYSFNHQIRFNSNHEFNTPFGRNRSSYNTSTEKNLIRFCTALQKKNVVLSAGDFSSFNFSDFGSGDFVYCDPPYLITTGSYNDGKRGFKDWSEKEEQELLALLDALDAQNVGFALSNVFHHKGAANDLLIEWSKKHHVLYIDKSYANCSYHFKDRDTVTVEVLITNYLVDEPVCDRAFKRVPGTAL